MNHKELWLDVATLKLATETNVAFISIGEEVIVDTVLTYPVNARSLLEVTIAQSSVNDLEDANYFVDSMLIGNSEFPDLVEGDSVRLNVLNRTITPTITL
jgi:hypothetical protein